MDVNKSNDFSIKLFNTYNELCEWAKNSTFGGGKLIEIEDANERYYIADRMYTSGMISSEVSIYKKREDKYCLVYQLPFKYIARSYGIHSGQLVIIEHLSKNRESKIILDLDELNYD